jgi:hypothetical protein
MLLEADLILVYIWSKLSSYANIDLVKYDKDLTGQNLIDLLEKHCFEQTISKPTRITENSATLIDHVYSNNINNVMSCNVLTLDYLIIWPHQLP